MAARKLRPRHQQEVRDKIQTSQLINRLQNYALSDGDDLSAGRIKAIDILLRKTLPDLTAAQVTGADGEPLYPPVIQFVVDEDSPEPSAN